MSDSSGLKLGNYRIVRLIGRGGFANVYLGEHIYLKIPAAIKVLTIPLVPTVLEHFLAEARLIALLEHPRIIRILEFGVEDARTPFLVMNYAENGSLRQRYPRKGTLPWPDILSATKQVAEALDYAHAHGVIHRDVKPENMLMGKNHHILLSDFGLALLADNRASASGSAGTTAYMAPEQLQGNPCPASDQYALGIAVYEWICGSPPFAGSEREMTVQHLYAAPPSIRIKRPDVSPAIEHVIMKALAKDPQARFATVQEFAQALEYAHPSGTLLDTKEGLVKSLVVSPTMVSPQADAAAFDGLPPHPETVLAQQQEHMEMPSVSTFFPHLPLMVSDSPFTNSGRLAQPSLGSSIASQKETIFPMAFSSKDDQAYLPLSTPSSSSFHDLSTSAFLPVTPHVTQRPTTPFPLAPHSGTRTFSLPRRTAFTALLAITLFGLVLLLGRGIWPQNAHPLPKASLHQHVTALPFVYSTATSSTGSHAPTHHTTTSVPMIPTHPPVAPASTPIVATAPTPVTSSTPVPPSTPAPQPTPFPSPEVTPTPVVPFTVAILSAPDSAVVGSTIIVITQASEGGVKIKLDGIVRHFGHQIADSHGAATFQITAPLLAGVIVLTATAISTNGNQVQSASRIINITPN
jgi:serine/threonine protein kinase